jgi:pimeloyl-ACP methyl ester carboxylesterase
VKSSRVFGSVKRRLGISAVVLAVVAAFSVTGSAASADQSADRQVKPTIVLVHGAFADASSWADVTKKLQRKGYPVVAPANPLRGLASDSAYLASFLKSIEGPVVLVGHSYGGEVISQAASTDPEVKALVYIAAFIPEAGETAGGLSAQFPGSKLGPDTTTAVPYAGGADLYVKQSSFHDVFAADLPSAASAQLGASQRPVDAAALGDVFQGPAAWHAIPSWALVATQDNAIPPAAERFMAKRAHARTIEVKASHLVAVSHPDDVAGLISDAARSVK